MKEHGKMIRLLKKDSQIYLFLYLLFCDIISKQYQNKDNINNFLIWKQNIRKIQILLIFYSKYNINIILSKNQFSSKLKTFQDI